jgi:hypothetical protein
MLKKSFCAVIIIMVIVLSSFPSYAYTTVLDILQSRDIKSTDEFLVSIVRPEGDETVSKKTYAISGVAKEDEEDIRVHIFIENDKGEFVEFKNTNGESSWDIGASGTFIKEVIFPAEGINSIRIAAYKKSEVENLEAGKNLQINDFKITVLPKGYWNEILKINVTKFLKSLVGAN